MEAYKIQKLETIGVVVVFFISRLILSYFVKLRVLKSYIKNAESKDISKIFNLLLSVVFFLIIVAIWSVKQENLLLFASSLLTVFGVAMFAEMSILSNITASIILFFQHPIQVGDTLSLVYEGNEIEGELLDITYFFVFIKTTKNGTVTIPNAVFLKSTFCIKETSEPTDEDSN
jgi:small-conductance mechanosensitive channel